MKHLSFYIFLQSLFYSNCENKIIEKRENMLLNQNVMNITGFIQYGNWCGPGHGGFQDCCNNTKCQHCNLIDNTLTDDCLNECKPIDRLDYYCAIHDMCCLKNEKQIVCFPEGNKCYCDCVLISGAEAINDCISNECIYYRSRLLSLFNYGLSCWYNNKNNIPVCNIISIKDYSIKDFCINGEEINPFDIDN